MKQPDTATPDQPVSEEASPLPSRCADVSDRGERCLLDATANGYCDIHQYEVAPTTNVGPVVGRETPDQPVTGDLSLIPTDALNCLRRSMREVASKLRSDADAFDAEAARLADEYQRRLPVHSEALPSHALLAEVRQRVALFRSRGVSIVGVDMGHVEALCAAAEEAVRLRAALRALVDFPVAGPACHEHAHVRVGCAACAAETDYVRRWETVDAQARAALGEESDRLT